MGKDVQLFSSGALYSAWYRLLNRFSTRSLTHQKDCLPAIAGLAKSFQDKLDDQYCAGLWKRDILHGMPWKTGYQNDEFTQAKYFTKARMKISSEDSGSSWNWITAFSSGLTWPDDSCRSAITAKLIDIEVYRATADDFGQISGGKLTLKATYRDISLRQGSSVFPRPSKLSKFCTDCLGSS
jgi:hypothetical protein